MTRLALFRLGGTGHSFTFCDVRHSHPQSSLLKLERIEAIESKQGEDKNAGTIVMGVRGGHTIGVGSCIVM